MLWGAGCLMLFLLAACNGSPPVSKETDDSAQQDEADYRGFYVEGRHLHDRCGERVVLRGVNNMVVINEQDGMPAFREIAKTGANTVRIMWMTWAPPEEFDETLTNAINEGLIPIIELHDATGEWEKLDDMVDYWVRSATVEVLKRHEQHLLVNIANEAGDHSVTDEQFKEGYKEAIARMRRAGVRTPLVIDAAGWGRDVEQLLRTAPWLMKQDPQDNLLFSVHWWHSDNDKQRITNALSEAVEKKIPLIVGEFAHKEVGCKGRIAYEHILAEAQRLKIGWLAWSWGPGNADCAEMDMTEDGTYGTLHGWGREVALTHPYSIKNTSERPASTVQGSCEAN